MPSRFKIVIPPEGETVEETNTYTKIVTEQMNEGRISQGPLTVMLVPESYLNLEEHWEAKDKVLPTHFFHLANTLHNPRVERFLRDHDDLICRHEFSHGSTTSTSQIADEMALVLEIATYDKLDTRRMTWVPKYVPKYSSKRIRRGNVDPFDKHQSACLVSIDSDLQDRYQRSYASSSHPTINSNLDSIDGEFDLGRLEPPKSDPVIVDQIVDRDAFCSGHDKEEAAAAVNEGTTAAAFQCQDMMIKAPGQNVLVPQELALTVHEFLVKSVTHFSMHSQAFHEYFAYLTVNVGMVPPWGTQRRPGLHADGFFSHKHSPLVQGRRGSETNEIIYLACSAVPPVFYVQDDFGGLVHELDREHHDFWVAMATRTTHKPKASVVQPFDIAMMDGYCPHAVATHRSLTAIPRTFVRLMFSKQPYALEGNTRNPHFAPMYQRDNWNWVPTPTVQAPAKFWNGVQRLLLEKEPKP